MCSSKKVCRRCRSVLSEEGVFPLMVLYHSPTLLALKKVYGWPFSIGGGGRLGLARLATRPTTSNNIVHYIYILIKKQKMINIQKNNQKVSSTRF